MLNTATQQPPQATTAEPSRGHHTFRYPLPEPPANRKRLVRFFH